MLKPFVILSSFLFVTNAWSQETLPLSDAEKAVGQVEKEIENPKSPLNKVAKTVEKSTDPNSNSKEAKAFRSRLDKELSKFRIRLTIDPLGNVVDTEHLKGTAYYQFVVEPAFRNNEQVRRDIWVTRVNLGAGALSTQVQVRLTFSRYFGGPKAKMDAIKARVKWFWEAPLETNDVKTKLEIGDGYRFEVSGDVALGKSTDLSNSGVTGSAYGLYKRGGLFIMDLYKVSEKQARVRFIGMKNRGEVEAGLNFSNPEVFALARGKLRDILTIGFGASVRKSLSFTLDPMTLDTLMVDYLFNFSKKEGIDKEQMAQEDYKNTSEASLDEVFKQLKKGGLVSIFLFFSEDKDLMKRLRDKIPTVEQVAKADLEKFNKGQIKFQDLRIYNYFRGRFTSDLVIGSIYGRLSEIIGGSSQSGSIKSHVASYDENEKAYYYWLDNGFSRHTSRSLFGRNKYNVLHDLDVLIYSDAKKGVGPLSDVVVRTQIEDTEMDKDKLAGYKKSIMGSLPGKYKNDAKIGAIFKDSEQTNSYLSYRLSFGEKAFLSIGKVDAPALAMELINYFETHPERSYMYLPTDRPAELGPIGMGTYSYEKATQIKNIFDPDANYVERMNAFEVAKRDPVFERYLVGEVFPRMIPQDNPEDLFSFDIRFSSHESGTITESIGNNRVSRVYDAVAFMRSIINDQSHDMQMSSSEDHTGNRIVVPSNQDGFLAPLVEKPVPAVPAKK